MKFLQLNLAVGLLALLTTTAHAATRYVDLNSPNPTSPYTDWSTAATNIQDAVDVADLGDTVLVTNGIYQTGGRAVYGAMTNRVAVTKPLVVQSVNGPHVTTIMGAAASSGVSGNGDGAVRCAMLVSNAVLKGFTLTGGYTRASGDILTERSGGGAWCEPGAIIRHSIVISNSATGYAGGAYGGSLYNCEITRNSGADGAGAFGALLFNCTVVRNQGTSRATAGTAFCTNYNTIVYFNNSSIHANYSGSAFFWSCTTPFPTNGIGNLTNSPEFVDLEAGVLRLKCGSLCIDAGTNLNPLLTDDLRGYPRPVDGNGDGSALYDMGAYERNPAYDAQDIGVRTGFTNFALRFSVPFVAQIDGCASNFWWDFGDGTVISNQFAVVHTWTTPGTFAVRLTAQFDHSGLTGMATTTVHVVKADYYVNAANSTPAYPYTNWSSAATNIQDAVNAGTDLGRLVLVTNGIYKTGGMALYGLTNRVALTNGVTLRSVNGPDVTVIVGSESPGGGNGNGAVRGVYVDKHSVVDGFTITNGHTLESMTVDRRVHNGGGVWCEPDAIITNCLIVGNSADFEGGGVSGGNIKIGGNGKLYACRIISNSGYYGGGVAYSTLFNCLVLSNSLYTAAGGGGTLWSVLYGCTVIGNSAGFNGGNHGGSLYNCIIYYNTPGNQGGNYFYCCTTPLPPGPGNITNAPLFTNVGGAGFQLQSNSPCINAGNNSYATNSTDLDGYPRISGGTVDIGAFEFQSPDSVLSYAWAQRYDVPTDGSADSTDDDGDGMDNYGEWRSDTIPTNSASVLKVTGVTNDPGGALISWESVTNRNYWLERADELGGSPLFQSIATNLPGVNGTKTYVDVTATNDGPFFYRVGVQE